jgi:hypothetical protein
MLACALALAASARPAASQLMRDSSTDWLASAGSETERYLRTLQVAGKTRPIMWSIRPFSGQTLRGLAQADSGQPWEAALAVRPTRAAWIHPIQPELGGIFNSTFPYGINDGPIWAGRGLTASVSVGVEGAAGPLEFRLAPQLFRAQNARFTLGVAGSTGKLVYADPRYPLNIDQPQRFGDGAYQRLDPGQSSVSLHLLHLAVGASTENELWGPAVESPFLLGTNAAGFAHLFAGTDGDVTLGPIDLGGRVIAGRLEQSDYSAAAPSARRRTLAGLVVVGRLRQLPNLEIGAGRVFEQIYPDSGVNLGRLLRPLFEGFLKIHQLNGTGGTDAANQLASFFARWAFPRSGLEVYGEIGREDHSWDLRDYLLEPDHDMTYMLGLQRAWQRPDGELIAVRGELLNSSMSHLNQVRMQLPPYIHDLIVQGHTNLGQVLGAPGAYGGGATTIAVDWSTKAGRRSLTWRRIDREPPTPGEGVRDIIHALTADRLVFGSRVDLVQEVTLAYNLNRNLGGDALNLRVALTGKAHW